MKHLMIDLETMGVGNNAAIKSIGAVKFNIENEELGEGFYKVVNLQSCIEIGLETDESTKEWWSKQDDIIKLDENAGDPIKGVLEKLKQFYRDNDKGFVWVMVQLLTLLLLIMLTEKLR